MYEIASSNILYRATLYFCNVNVDIDQIVCLIRMNKRFVFLTFLQQKTNYIRLAV